MIQCKINTAHALSLSVSSFVDLTSSCLPLSILIKSAIVSETTLTANDQRPNPRVRGNHFLRRRIFIRELKFPLDAVHSRHLFPLRRPSLGLLFPPLPSWVSLSLLSSCQSSIRLQVWVCFKIDKAAADEKSFIIILFLFP